MGRAPLVLGGERRSRPTVLSNFARRGANDRSIGRVHLSLNGILISNFRSPAARLVQAGGYARLDAEDAMKLSSHIQ